MEFVPIVMLVDRPMDLALKKLVVQLLGLGY
jgi:hypothetical protein